MANMVCGGIFAGRTNVERMVGDVFFTTIAKWGSDATATPTGVGREEVEEARKCCVFYNN